MRLLRFFLPSLLLIFFAAGQATVTLMDPKEKETFLQSIDQELDSEDDVSVIYPAAASTRRLSAASRGLELRRRSLEEIGEVPPKLSPIVPPAGSVPDLGQSFLTNPPPDPLSTPKQTVCPPVDIGGDPDVEDSPKTNRSGRKRRLPVDSAERKQKRKMATKPGQAKEDDDPFAKLAKMIKNIESKIEQSEVRMATKIESKIDTLSTKLESRLDKTEAAISETQEELREIKEIASEANIRKIVGAALADRPEASREPGLRPRPFRAFDSGPGFASTPARPNEGGNTEAKDERYWLARRQLRIWPVTDSSSGGLEAGVRDFLRDRLLVSESRLPSIKFTVQPIESRRDSAIKDQVVVTFDDSRTRDEVKSKTTNLRGSDKGVGCQLEPPDHLRGQYAAFQNLAFCLKKKNPELKRNIKFDDRELSLIMDIKTDEGWKTIEYQAARDLLRRRTQRSNSISRRQLKDILNASDVIDSEESMDEDTVILNTDENKPRKKCLHAISFLNTNARSLGPKITSLADCFEEKLLDFASVTETWFQSDRLREELEVEMNDKYSLGMFSRERATAANNGRQYGGVAMVYRKHTCSFDEFPLTNPDNYEVLAAVGRVTGVKGKVFCISCYAPPNLDLAQARGLIEFVSDLVGEAKRSYGDCTIVVNGDFNHWPAEELLDDHPDLREVEHGPTRGHRKIDRSFTNIGRSIVESGVLPPLETEAGNLSDHRMVFVKAVFKAAPKNNITYTHRPVTMRGVDKFVNLCAGQDWHDVLAKDSANDKAEAFQAILRGYVDEAFPVKTTTRRASDPPWVNHQIRKLTKKRRRVYDREGRSRKWKRLKKKSDELYRERARNYVEHQKEKLTGPEAARTFYKHVKAFSSKEKPPGFDPCTLFPGESAETVAERLADHFNKISDEFDGVQPGQIPVAPSIPLPTLTTLDVRDRILSFRKPKSMVEGDIPPSVVNRVAQFIACPLASIYNDITRNHDWPSSWKVETVTPIPKKSMPQSPDDVRNISCTQLFSKIYESFVLTWLGNSSSMRPNQYGGVKGSGTEHFLLQLWQDVLENSDDSRASTLISSIDYSKAFNRLDFVRCLNALKAKGVGQELLNIIASFLSGRRMTVKVGDAKSSLKDIEGGVPQGSLLGVHLFNSTIDNFEAFARDAHEYGPWPAETLSPEELLQLPADLPVNVTTATRDHKHLPIFRERAIGVQKYVDDNILVEKINFDRVRTDGYTFRTIQAIKLQNVFRQIVARAEIYGMAVNASKTQAMLISEVKSYIPQAYFYDSNGVKITTRSEMKILGFHLSSSPDMTAQVESIKRKYRSRIWILRHLSYSGLSNADLLRVYRSVILPCHDYCCVVFHSSLTATQSNQLERLQSQALKCIYGYEHSYRALLELSGLSTLKVRRENRCDKFALKTQASARYKHWFPMQEQRRALRARPPFQELPARTSRLYNSPLYDLRRRLNRLLPPVN